MTTPVGQLISEGVVGGDAARQLEALYVLDPVEFWKRLLEASEEQGQSDLAERIRYVIEKNKPDEEDGSCAVEAISEELGTSTSRT